MIAWVLAMALCMCLYLSQVSVLSKRIELGFGMEASIHLYYTVLKGNSRVFKNKDTSLWNFVPNSDLGNFCYRLSPITMDAQGVINWSIVGQVSWQYLRAPTLDRCSLLQVIAKLCLQHDIVARVD